MTDWERVRRLRARGVDWRTIATDPRVEFNPPEGADASRALKALYLRRQSRKKGAARDLPTAEVEPVPESRRKLDAWLPIVGLVVLVASLIWLIFSIASPASAVILPALPPMFPDVLIVVIAGALLVGAVVLGRFGSLGIAWRKSVAVGVVVGIVLVGTSAGLQYLEGIPNLNPVTSPAGVSGWQLAQNPLWKTDGRTPVFFFYGSEACPFCAASSWAFFVALSKFGSLMGYGYTYSSPSDSAGPNTPEVALSGSSLQSGYISWDVREDPYNLSISYPSVSPTENAYVRTYNSGLGIPFVVIGGKYIHGGTFVNPQTLSGLTVGQVQQHLASANPSDPVYFAIHQQAVNVEAFLEKVCLQAGISPPSAVANDPEVQTVLATILS